MEKVFNAKEWLDRCRSCKYAKYSRNIGGTTCNIKGPCNYIKRADYQEIEEEIENGKNNLGKICPKCGKFFLFADAPTAYIKDGIKHYTYCRDCKNEVQREYHEKQKRKKDRQRREKKK